MRELARLGSPRFTAGRSAPPRRTKATTYFDGLSESGMKYGTDPYLICNLLILLWRWRKRQESNLPRTPSALQRI